MVDGSSSSKMGQTWAKSAAFSSEDDFHVETCSKTSLSLLRTASQPGLFSTFA